MTPWDLLVGWLHRQAPESSRAWLDGQIAKLDSEARDRDVYLALGLVPRKLGKADLDLERSATSKPPGGRDPAGTRAAGASIRRRAS